MCIIEITFPFELKLKLIKVLIYLYLLFFFLLVTFVYNLLKIRCLLINDKPCKK